MSKRIGQVFVVLTLLFFCVTGMTKDKNYKKQNVMLILDASGSMWGQIDGKAKIEIARNAISKILSSWNKNVDIGVMAYGHRVKGDCSDIQKLIPVGSLNQSKVMKILNDLTPKGKTPLGAAIKIAADTLKLKEEAATVVLVSDGLDTCGMNPCAVAKHLKKHNINLRIHVIGFDVNAEGDISKLKCIAKNTGGKYFSANNAKELNAAMNIVHKIVQKKIILKPILVKMEAPEPAPKPILVKTAKASDLMPIIVKHASAKQVGLKLQATLASGSKPVSAGIHYSIYKLNPDGTKSKKLVTQKSNAGGVVFAELAPGKYYAEAHPEHWYSNYSAKTGIIVEVKKDKLSHYVFTLDLGELELKIDSNTSTVPGIFQYDIDTNNPSVSAAKDVAYIMRRDIDKKTGKAVFLLKPGKYRIYAKTKTSNSDYAQWVKIKHADVTITLNKKSYLTFDLENKK